MIFFNPDKNIMSASAMQGGHNEGPENFYTFNNKAIRKQNLSNITSKTKQKVYQWQKKQSDRQTPV